MAQLTSWLHGGNQLWYIWVGQAGATISAISVISAFDLPYLTYDITHTCYLYSHCIIN